MIEYELGARPSTPLTLLVRNELDQPVNVVGYDSWSLEILDSNDDLVDMNGVSITELPNAIGAFSVAWPKFRTVFDQKGVYVMRLVLRKNDGSQDITRAAEIRVREFGRIK